MRSGYQAAPEGDLADLRTWIEAEYAKARQAARDAAVHNRNVRQNEGIKAAVRASHPHTSAVARMCALGEVLQRLGWEVPSC